MKCSRASKKKDNFSYNQILKKERKKERKKYIKKERKKERKKESSCGGLVRLFVEFSFSKFS